MYDIPFDRSFLQLSNNINVVATVRGLTLNRVYRIAACTPLGTIGVGLNSSGCLLGCCVVYCCCCVAKLSVSVCLNKPSVSVFTQIVR